MKRPRLDTINIIDAVNDGRLIGDALSGAQETALRVLYGLPLSESQLGIYCKATERTDYVPAERKEAAFICGRRSGKDDKLAANVAIYESLFREHKLSKGERGFVALLSATREQAKVTYDYIRGKLEASPVLRSLIDGEPRADEIDLVNRTSISVQPANFRSIRGRSVLCGICSEIAFWRDLETNANPAGEILRALRPSLTTFPNSKLILISSPFTKSGLLWEAWKARHVSGSARLAWRLDSLTMNPTLDVERLREEQAADEENYRREYLAEFWDSSASFLRTEAIDAVVVRERFELHPLPSTHCVAATDVAMRKDNWALSILHRSNNGKVVQDLTRCWAGSKRNPPNMLATVAEITEILRRYGISKIAGDQYCAEPVKQAFATRGIEFVQCVTLGNRAGCWSTLHSLIASGQIELLDDSAQTAELKRLERITTSGGNMRIEAADGSHDDRAIALALSAHQAFSEPSGSGDVYVSTNGRGVLFTKDGPVETKREDTHPAENPRFWAPRRGLGRRF